MKWQKRQRHALCTAVLGLFWAASALGQQSTPRGASSGPHVLPDWSGWWHSGSVVDEWAINPPPLTPGILERFRTERREDLDPDPLRYCRRPGFTGYSGGLESVEFLITPGRVTLLNESGLIRRIYTDGRSMPADLSDTSTGTSVGHWEGQTLVVETAGIAPATKYPAANWGGMPVGNDVRITERISLKNKTLQFEIVTIAPDVLTAPDRRTRVYTRWPVHEAREVNYCVDVDRAVDPATGHQRFDMTPPADLPPPPAR